MENKPNCEKLKSEITKAIEQTLAVENMISIKRCVEKVFDCIDSFDFSEVSEASVEDIKKEANWRFTTGHGATDDYSVKVFIAGAMFIKTYKSK